MYFAICTPHTLRYVPTYLSIKRTFSCVAKSTCEAEYMACPYACNHLIWTKLFVNELNNANSADNVVKYCLLTDNQPALWLIRDSRINARSKHIAVHFHFVRERYFEGHFNIDHIPFENLADICTKALSRPTLQHLVSQMAC